MISKQKIINIQEWFFNIFIIVSYILVIIYIFNLSSQSLVYLNTLDYYVKIYVSLFLIWRFNPLRSYYEFTNLDRKIAFSAGIFLLTTTFLFEYFNNFKNKLLKIIHTN